MKLPSLKNIITYGLIILLAFGFLVNTIRINSTQTTLFYTLYAVKVLYEMIEEIVDELNLEGSDGIIQQLYLEEKSSASITWHR